MIREIPGHSEVIENLSRERDEARAVVERLKAELDELASAAQREWLDVRRRKAEADLRGDLVRRERDDARAVARAILLMAQERTRTQFVSDLVLDGHPWLKG